MYMTLLPTTLFRGSLANNLSNLRGRLIIDLGDGFNIQSRFIQQSRIKFSISQQQQELKHSCPKFWLFVRSQQFRVRKTQTEGLKDLIRIYYIFKNFPEFLNIFEISPIRCAKSIASISPNIKRVASQLLEVFSSRFAPGASGGLVEFLNELYRKHSFPLIMGMKFFYPLERDSIPQYQAYVLRWKKQASLISSIVYQKKSKIRHDIEMKSDEMTRLKLCSQFDEDSHCLMIYLASSQEETKQCDAFAKLKIVGLENPCIQQVTTQPALHEIVHLVIKTERDPVMTNEQKRKILWALPYESRENRKKLSIHRLEEEESPICQQRQKKVNSPPKTDH